MLSSTSIKRTSLWIRSRCFSTQTTTSIPLQLYQYQICPFCNIVKSVLNFSKIPYQTIEVNPLTKAEIKWSQGYTKVPIATADDKHWFGSDDIVHGVLNSTNTKITSKKGDEKWTKYAMDDLAPLLYPNLCNTLGNSYRAFDYVHSVPSFSTLQKFSIQSIGSLAMYMAASKIKQKRNITDERQALKDALIALEDSLTNQSFLSQQQQEPSLGDLYVFGVLRGLEGLAVHQDVMESNQQIAIWYSTMKGIVE